MHTHAQVPTPLLLREQGIIRVYFASRPKPTLSLTTYCDLDMNDPTRVVSLNTSPILDCGLPGTFDEHGIMPSCAVSVDGAVYLYYSGWSRGASVPYTNSTGLAISEDGGRTFSKYSSGPILAKSSVDPFSATSPCVVRTRDEWHMWYCSGTAWNLIDQKYEHTYDIKYAASSDGIDWRPTGAVAVPAREAEEALTRPWVIAVAPEYTMWFCYRGCREFRDGPGSYRLATASSSDGEHWRRDDDLRFSGGESADWDSRMAAYPAVLFLNGHLYMLYNGNGFGASGFGLATASL